MSQQRRRNIWRGGEPEAQPHLPKTTRGTKDDADANQFVAVGHGDVAVASLALEADELLLLYDLEETGVRRHEMRVSRKSHADIVTSHREILLATNGDAELEFHFSAARNDFPVVTEEQGAGSILCSDPPHEMNYLTPLRHTRLRTHRNFAISKHHFRKSC